MAWNRWLAGGLSEEKRGELIANGFEAFQLAALTKEEETEFLKDFVTRAGRSGAMPPDPHEAIDSPYGGIDFEEVRFQAPVVLSGFIFPCAVSFEKAVFSSDADFVKAVFSGNTGFSRAVFARAVSFNEATFSGSARFSDTTFSYYADFMGAEFKLWTFFAGAKFKTFVPDFRDAKLCEAIEWHGTEWPAPPTDKEEAQQQIYAYERLKLEMERLKKHADEQFFFAKELRARRALERRGSLKWLLNYAYELSSDYGQSVALPSFWLIVVFALGVDFFALAPVHTGAPLTYDVAESLSIANILPFLPHKPDKDITEHLSAWAEIVSDIQSVLGVVLLFLLGLGLRNRFRMK